MSKEKFIQAAKAFQKIGGQDFVSMNVLMQRLTQELGYCPTLTTLASWSKSSKQPRLTNFSDLLNPNGEIKFGIYYYPEVKHVVSKYYKKFVGPKKRN